MPFSISSPNTGGTGNANTADFVFTDNYNETGRSGIILPGDKGITIAAGEESDLYLTAGDDLYIQTLGEGDDIHLNAADDIRFTTGNQNIDFYTPPDWRMNSEGRFILPGGGYITNPIESSGDGSDLSTINLFPDGNITSDQYVIIDPTSPNHIHLRAGGVQDNSSAHIFLGGERTNIEVSDPYRTVKISAKPDGTENTYANSNEASNTEFVHASTADILPGDTVRLYTGGPTYVVDNVTQEYPYAGAITVTAPGLSFITGEAYIFTRDQGNNNQWTFANDAKIYFPNGSIMETPMNEGHLSMYASTSSAGNGGGFEIAGGSVAGDNKTGGTVNIIGGGANGYNSTGGNVVLETVSSGKILLTGNGGEFLNNMSIANNQIATIGDLPTGATGTFETSDSKLVTVTNGIITAIDPLT